MTCLRSPSTRSARLGCAPYRPPLRPLPKTNIGTAAPMFVFGKGLKGGLYGAQPSLADLVDGDLKHVIDFRSVYATVLDRWLGADPVEILGSSFDRVGFI